MVQDVTYAGNFGHIQKGHGISFADLDNDGDQDIYAVMGGSESGDNYPNAVFENPGNLTIWTNILLEGTASNRSAIGARVRIDVGTPEGSMRSMLRTESSGFSFGANSLQLEVGLGADSESANMAVDWPDGVPGFKDYCLQPVNRALYLKEGSAIRERKLIRFNFSDMDHSSHHVH